eukprot:jgi/Chrzof1/9191/Cz03g39090.t1
MATSERFQPGGCLEQKLYKAAQAGNAQTLCYVLEHGADVSYQNNEGVSPLMVAAENGHADIVRILLEAGSPWNAQDKDGYCAGDYATASKRQEIVELLMHWGVQAELLLAAVERRAMSGQAEPSNSSYLQQKLRYDGDKLLNAEGEAVMMGWEGPLMTRHAQEICRGGGDILNVGFGLGLIDEAIQSHNPRTHTIIEAHPDVYAHMLQLGWDKRPGVRILFGRWQDVLGQLGTYDGIFFDTYGEYYEELRSFHLHLPDLLNPAGVYSFFNGLAPDNLFFHLVYGRLVQVELSALGIGTAYMQERVDELGDEVWRGVKNKYWHFPVYFLPVCRKIAGWQSPATAQLTADEGDEAEEEEEQQP